MLSKEFHHHSNSDSIREKHADVFKALYQACPTVVSAPAVMLWSPFYAVGTGGIGIVSKLPFRIHIGIEPTSNGTVEFGPTKYYLPEKDVFEDWDPTRCNPILLRLLESVAKKYGKNGGARIWCISEIPWYRGLNVDSIYGVACAAAWLLYVGAVSAADITEFVALPTEKLIGSPSFEQVFRLAWKFESIISAWIGDGHMSFASLIDSQYPVVFFREKDPFLFDHYRDHGLDNPASYYNASDSLFYRGIRLNELFPLDQNPAWPIDFALVFTGEEGDTRFVYQSRGATKVKLDEAAAFAEKTLQGYVPATFRQTPNFLELAHDTPNQSAGMNLYQVFRKNFVAHSISVLKDVYNLFQYGISEKELREFFSNQSLCQHLLRVLDLSPHQITKPMNLIRLVGSKKSEVGISCRLTGPGNHGCIQVVGPAKTLEGVLQDALPQMVTDGIAPSPHVHYASWCDGATASVGVRIEQHASDHIFSRFTDGKSATVRELSGGEPPKTLLMTAEKLASSRGEYDLLIDRREGKLYVRGTQLTSAQIHSAKQTIELIVQFVNRGVAELKASELPKSIYSEDRNQMESKIVRPIANAVKEATGRPLGLEVHGGLASNFSVKFQPDPHLRIGLVERS